ncbi:peptidoglycan-binding protein [Streptomyces sp. NPDC056361]|uniref:peptidoglycan-binding domain-containing protein n=1 Tax=Streptomyces sp. NPDC056361 TaxID=3345795 RepID=UPI0035D8A738
MDVSRAPAGRRYPGGGGEPEGGEEPGRGELLRGSGHAVIFRTSGRHFLGKAKLSVVRVHVKPVCSTSQSANRPVRPVRLPRPPAGQQRLLNAHVPDLQALAVDGRFGPVTEQHVRKFQTRLAITVDGIVGPQTGGRTHALSEPLAQTRGGGRLTRGRRRPPRPRAKNVQPSTSGESLSAEAGGAGERTRRRSTCLLRPRRVNPMSF